MPGATVSWLAIRATCSSFVRSLHQCRMYNVKCIMRSTTFIQDEAEPPPHWRSLHYTLYNAPFARVYTLFISRKKYSPFHTVLVFYWFSLVLSVKALKIKPSHRAAKCSHGQHSIHTGGEHLWRLEKPSLHTRNNWESGIKSHRVKEWMLFFGIKIRIEEHDFWGR